MALTDLDVKQQFNGTGLLTDFAIPYTMIFDDSVETKVYVDDTLQTEGAGNDYTLIGAPDVDSFHTTVRFNAAPANSTVITIIRQLTLEQALDLITGGSLNLETLEQHLDGIVAKIQQLDEILERVPKLKITTQKADQVMPDPQPEYLLRWNAAQTQLENVTAAEVVEDGSAALLSEYISHSVTDGQSATDLNAETVDSAIYSSALYYYEITRGTTVHANGWFALQYLNSAWRLVTGPWIADEAHGVTFSVSETGGVAQVRAALDAGAGNGTIKLSHRLISQV